MRNWRVLTAVLAVILAVVAGVLAWQYLDDADERASEDFELVEVLVAAEDIPEGTTGADAIDQGLFETFEIQQNAVPDKAVPPDQVDALAERVAAANVSAQQLITTDTFVSPLEVGRFANTIDDGMQAISFAVSDVTGVGGFVVPNDTVNLMATVDIEPLISPQSPEGEPVEGGDEALTTTAYLIPGLKVLAVGETTTTSGPDEQDDQGGPAGIVTVEVDARQALQIAHATAQGTLYLSLNPPGFELDGFQGAVEIVEAVNWFDQELFCVSQLRAVLAASADPAAPLGALNAPACVAG